MSNNILLTVYTYVDGVSDTPFPNADNPLKIKYTYNAQRMGSSSLTATAMYPTCLDDLWVSGKQYVDFKGERYFIVKTPSSSKSNDDVRYKHELEFLSGRSVLDNVYVYDVVTGDAGSTDRYVSNSTKVLFYGDIQEFVARLNFSLEYSNLAYRIVIDEGITSEAKQVSLENMFFSNALQEIFNIFELPFYFVGTTIHVGFTNNAITHTFKYGKDFELLSVSKTNANYKITNRVTGTGSSDNIQFYYPNPSNDRKAIEEAGGTWITPSQVLMPPIYRQTNGAERFYNALNNKYINPDTGDYYTFENLYLPTNPKEQIVDFSYIKPSIKNALNKAGVRMDVIKAIAFDQNDDDSINKDTGEYVHSYFYVKLNKFDGDFGFNLFDQALVGSDATVSMTSGACGACNFQIGVTEITQEGKQVFRNPVQVDSKGDIVPGDYAQKVNVNNLQPQQQNTMTNEVWIALKKDNTTFGIVMPNAGNNIKPSAGDSFVFLNIDMPQAYITKAEKELEEAIIKYMANNNREKFTFSIKLSRIFLAENPSIGNLLNENARIDLEYNGQFHQLYVSNYTLKVDENVLPEISIQLTDTLTIGKNSLQTAIDGVKQDIMNSIGSVDFLKQGLKYFLRKDTSDYARDFITFLRGLKVGSYTEGGNSGGIFAIDANGKTYIETDMLKVRAKAYFETLEIINTNSIGGRQIITPGGSITCNKVVEGDTYYRCYFVNDADNTPIENRFKVDDQALSQDFNIKEGIYENVSNHYYWRKVVAIGEDYIDLSKTDADVSSDIPKAGDVICQLGNKTDKTRQNAIIFSAVDFYSPSITLYAGIDSYSYVNKEYVSYGVDKTTNEAFFNVYGRMYVGDRNKNSYMQYSEKDGLQIKGKLQVGTTIGSGQTVEDALEQTKNDAIAGAKENLDEFATIVNGSLGELQDQIDGAIETWFYDPVPTLTNQPAVNWTTDKDKNTHLGDLYYDSNGKAYRFQLTGTAYEWKVLTDSDITKALADAKKAQDTADSKRKIFVRQPLDTETYEVGDLWVNATFGSTYSNDVLRCKTAKAAGTSFSINHWEKASKYTDDQAALEAQRLAKAAQADVDQAKRDINGLDGEVDGLRNFTDQAFKDGVIDRSEATAIAKYLNNIETSQKDVSQSFAKVYNNPLLSGIAKTNLNNANIAFNTAATDLISTIRSAIADGITTNTEKAAVDDKYSVFNTKYGDYIAYLNEANKFIQDQIKTTADNALQKAVDLNYLKQAFKEETTITNGVVQTSILALGYTDGSSYKIMSGSNGIYDSSKIGGGIASWWGGSMKDRNDYTSENMPSDVAKGLVRFDGTGYFANGNLWWDNNGKLHADPLSFFVGPENVGDLLSIFQIVKSGSSISYVIPRYPFQKLSISSYLELGSGYRIKVDEANNAIYFEKADGGIVNFYATGGITALGAGTKSPQTILDALPIDTNTLSKEGGKLTVIGGGSGGNTGAISLNGQRYDSVDGVITLPNLKLAEPTTFALHKNYVSVRTAGRTSNQYYEFWDTDAGWAILAAKGYKTPEGTASQFLKADGSVDSNVYLTQSSTDSRYVLKTGDTMTGNLNVPFILTAVHPDNQGDYFYSSDDNFIRRSTWHAALSHLSQKQLILDLTSLDQNKWYPCIIGAPAYGGTPLRITIFNGLRDNKPSWASHASGFSLLLDYYVTGSGWGTLSAVSKLDWYHGSFGGETAFGGRQQNTMGSHEIIYLRGGGVYYYRTTNGQSITVNPNGYTWSSSSYNYSAPVKTSQDNSPMDKTFDQVYWAPNNLRNTRTLWGQPFNGSQNVSGALSGVTTINASDMIYTAGPISNRGSIYCNGRFIVDRGRHDATASPAISLAIGDSDTGLHWQADGIIEFRSNAKQVGYWGYTNGRLFNCYFREPSGVSYEKASLMINGNGSTISPSIGFHQPGVVGCNLRVDNGGNFLFEDASNYKSVYAYDFVAAGWLYSTANSCEVRIGSQNASHVHITNNKSRPYYMDNRLDISGHVIPYSANIYDLGESGKPWRQAYINNMHGSADAAGMLNTAYIGGLQPNPQTYFGPGTGLRVAMTGSIKCWNDTLWINGYSGDDVKDMCALHTVRNGTPQMYISTQKSDATSYGTMYLFYTSYNANKSDMPWICSTLNAYGRITTTSDIHSQSWVRTVGTTGWYSESYGGGIHMTDSTYVRVYNNKSFYVSGNILATGGITAKTTSDMRLKDRVGQIDYAKKLLSLGLVFDYIYNDTAKSRVEKMVDDKRHIGLSYQAVSKVLPAICGKDDDGYGYINYISPDFISLIAGATQLNTLGINELCKKTNSIEDEIKKLKKENECLKKEINKLKREYR